MNTFSLPGWTVASLIRAHSFAFLSVLCLCVPITEALAAPVIVEFMASNDKSLYDEDGESTDWMEIFNPDPNPVDIGGWFLTNDRGELNKWELPQNTILPSGGSLIIFASDKDRKGGELHTNFKLNRD
ncbi:lamin tail domain-containing protein, partial [Akkermansiaceae bacterium]|nr:lamin tail domain-containing protein [Akkermansiaceae bacterium]